MKILYVANEVIYPTNSGGRTRAYHLVKALAAQHSLGLAYISADHMPEDIGFTCEYIERIELSQTFDLSEFNPLYTLKLLILSLVHRSFPITLHWTAAKQMRAISELVAKEQPEVVILQASYLLPIARMLKQQFPHVRCVLDAHNVESILHQRMARSKRQPLRLIFSVLAGNLATLEQHAGLWVQAIAAVSEEDAKWFKQWNPSVEVSVVPNGVDLDFFKTNKKLPAEPVIAFSGLMSYRPNSEGAVWFAENVWPLILKREPLAKWLVIGRDPAEEVRALSTMSGVVVTGTVDDVRVWVEKSRLVVTPLLSGGGTRLKILEAMAMQRVVISTIIGAEGIIDSQGLLRIDDPRAMAEKVLTMLQSETDLLELGRANRKFVEQYYGWSAIGQDMVRLIEKAHSNG